MPSSPPSGKQLEALQLAASLLAARLASQESEEEFLPPDFVRRRAGFAAILKEIEAGDVETGYAILEAELAKARREASREVRYGGIDRPIDAQVRDLQEKMALLAPAS